MLSRPSRAPLTSRQHGSHAHGLAKTFCVNFTHNLYSRHNHIGVKGLGPYLEIFSVRCTS